jgi:type IV secretion system protein VirB6
MGLILTTLILTAPPMAAMFFQGTLGSFMAYSQIGGSGVGAQPGPQGQPPGSMGGGSGSYTPSEPRPTSGSPADVGAALPRIQARDADASVNSPGSRGNAPVA